MTTQQHILGDMPIHVMEIVSKIADRMQFKKGQVIFCEGNTPLGVFFVRQGKIKISKLGSDGKEQIIRIAAPNEMLGYTDIVSHTKYSTSAKAIEDTVLMFVSKQQFWSMIKEQPDLFENFILLLSMDLKEAENKIADLAYKPVRGRLADALIYLTNKFSEENADLHHISITRSDLACYVGTAKETVNRLLSEFRHENLVETDGTKINILNFKGLNTVSDMYN